jgi:hypothetical protein
VDELQKWTSGKFYLPLGVTERAEINRCLIQWFAATNKKQTPKLEQLVKEFNPRLSKLAQEIQLYYIDEKVHSEAPGESGSTLAQVKSGTLWFEPLKNFELYLLAQIQD